MKTVYIVDDSPLIRKRLLEMLSGLSDTRVIGEAGDAVEAMKGIRILNPDILILDIQLPGKSGIELLRDIRRAGIKTHVIVLTNFAYPQYRKECLEAGAAFFLNKVKDFERLPVALNSFERPAHKGKSPLDNPDGPPALEKHKPP